MSAPQLRKTSSRVEDGGSAPNAELPDDELRRRLETVGGGVGYDRRDVIRSTEPVKRIAFDMPASVHRQLRLKVAESGQTITSFFHELLAKEGFDVPEEHLVSDRRKLR